MHQMAVGTQLPAFNAGRTPVKTHPASAADRHYHYPANCRLRLAQILVLPPHQVWLLGMRAYLSFCLPACCCDSALQQQPACIRLVCR